MLQELTKLKGEMDKSLTKEEDFSICLFITQRSKSESKHNHTNPIKDIEDLSQEIRKFIPLEEYMYIHIHIHTYTYLTIAEYTFFF